MTEPVHQLQIEGTAAPVMCPDGRHRVAIILRAGAQVTLLLEPDQVEQFMASWAAQAADAAVEARRQQTGLILVGDGGVPVPQLPAELLRRRPTG